MFEDWQPVNTQTKILKTFTQNNQLESLSRNRSGHYLKCAMLVTLKELF